MGVHSQSDLSRLPARHPTLVGVDSDGCVFDTMETKQKRCFHPLLVEVFGWGALESVVRETAEFVNLYSTSRGSNRFAALVRTFDLLRERLEMAGAGIPDLRELRAMLGTGRSVSHEMVAKTADRTGSRELGQVAEWSRRVNEAVAALGDSMPPFPHAREALERIASSSDLVVVSQTPEEALIREWKAHGLFHLATRIAGQESGTKTEHLRRASAGGYGPGRTLMVGDALGDLEAARSVGALFYPILPGEEADSWRRFLDEAHDRFQAEAYAGPFEEELERAFRERLPEHPPWRKEPVSCI